jgi:uncharacterized membrane protein
MNLGSIIFFSILYILVGMHIARTFAHYSPTSIEMKGGNYCPPIIALIFWPPFAIACFLMYLNRTNEAMIKGYQEEIKEARRAELEEQVSNFSKQDSENARKAIRELEELRKEEIDGYRS